MARVPSEYRRVLAEHRRRLSKITDQQSVATLRKVYERAIADLMRRLSAVPGARRDRFTAHQYRTMLGQLRQGLALLMKRMAGGFGDISRTVQEAALHGLIDDVARLEQKFTGAAVTLPIEEAARFQGAVSGVRESLLDAHQASVARYGMDLIRRMEDDLTLGLTLGDDVGSVIDRIVQTADLAWWRAERVVRTETIWTYNATQQAGIRESVKELPDLMMRWTEYISDDGASLDDRVDVDSVAMHGQVAAPGDVFRFPPTLPRNAKLSAEQRKKWPKVRARFVGDSWAHPPNRPNDRASLSPWRPHWGVPAWQMVGGRRVSM